MPHATRSPARARALRHCRAAGHDEKREFLLGVADGRADDDEPQLDCGLSDSGSEAETDGGGPGAPPRPTAEPPPPPAAVVGRRRSAWAAGAPACGRRGTREAAALSALARRCDELLDGLAAFRAEVCAADAADAGWDGAAAEVAADWDDVPVDWGDEWSDDEWYDEQWADHMDDFVDCDCDVPRNGGRAPKDRALRSRRRRREAARARAAKRPAAAADEAGGGGALPQQRRRNRRGCVGTTPRPQPVYVDTRPYAGARYAPAYSAPQWRPPAYDRRPPPAARQPSIEELMRMDLPSLRRALQNLEHFTPEHYDLLLRLSEDDVPKTATEEQLAGVDWEHRHFAEADCTICLDELAEVAARLRCGHMFHADCLRRYLGSEKCCPLCKQEL